MSCLSHRTAHTRAVDMPCGPRRGHSDRLTAPHRGLAGALASPLSSFSCRWLVAVKIQSKTALTQLRVRFGAQLPGAEPSRRRLEAAA